MKQCVLPQYCFARLGVLSGFSPRSPRSKALAASDVVRSDFRQRADCIYNHDVMNNSAITLVLALSCLTACNKPSPASTPSPVTETSKSPDAVQQKLQEYSGTGATNCGRLNVQASADQSKSTADCAMQASQGKHPFYVAYDMPGMAIGVAGNAEGKLFSVQSQGSGATAAVTSGDCPSQLRVAASGRVTCFSPGDIGSMGAGHTAIPPDMANPHAFPKPK